MKLVPLRVKETQAIPKKQYIVDLSPAEREELLALTRKGTVQARKMKRRLGDKATLVRETQTLEDERNATKATIRWQFTTDHARQRLQRLYSCNSA